MINWIKPEHLVSLYLILNDKEEVTSYSLGNYAETLNKALKERKIDAIFLYSDKYVDEMLSDYKDYFEYNGLYEDAVTNYCTPWIKRKVSNEVLSELFTAYLSNDVLKVVSDLKEKEKGMTTEEMIEVMKAYTEGKHVEYRGTKNDPWREAIPRWDWNNFEYRIKPEKEEPKYRPYKDLEEFKKDIVRKYSGSTFENIFETRNIWLKSKCIKYIGQIVGLTNEHIFVDGNYYSWETLFVNYTYLDGTPFGVKE